MRFKDLFTVPEGQKITEKDLRRVLISSICSILLCMVCLAGTTWAWFTVELENQGNVIQIGEPEIVVKVDDEPLENGAQLTGNQTVKIVHANELDDLQKKSTLYVTLTINHDGGTITVYKTLKQENQYMAEITIEAEKAYTLGWEVSWFAPVNAIELIEGTIYLPAEAPAETDPATEPAEIPDVEDPTEASTEPETQEPTDPPTVPETQEPTESTEPAEEETE